MELFSSPPVRVQPYFGYRNADRLRIGARALKSGKPGFERDGRWHALRTMLAQFASREVEGLAIELELEDADGRPIRHRAVTDAEGFVQFDVPVPARTGRPERTGWDVVAFRWHNRDGAQCVEGHVLAPGTATRLAVISDVDDTLIETGITGGFRAILRNWQRVLAQLPADRIAVPDADLFYSALGGRRATHDSDRVGRRIAATFRPFFYISSSPWNLFSYLVAFQRGRGLPLGPLLLRDWGLDRRTLGARSHGTHKRDSITRLLAFYPDLRFALVGDDTQGDFPAFAQAIEDFPGRIAAVFIRTTGQPLSAEEKAAKTLIEHAGVPLWTGGDFATGRAFLNAAGLAQDRDSEAIIDTIEQGGPAPEAHDAARAVGGIS